MVTAKNAKAAAIAAKWKFIRYLPQGIFPLPAGDHKVADVTMSEPYWNIPMIYRDLYFVVPMQTWGYFGAV